MADSATLQGPLTHPCPSSTRCPARRSAARVRRPGAAARRCQRRPAGRSPRSIGIGPHTLRSLRCTSGHLCRNRSSGPLWSSSTMAFRWASSWAQGGMCLCTPSASACRGAPPPSARRAPAPTGPELRCHPSCPFHLCHCSWAAPAAGPFWSPLCCRPSAWQQLWVWEERRRRGSSPRRRPPRRPAAGPCRPRAPRRGTGGASRRRPSQATPSTRAC
mmetsp:Transcript_36923/g.106483  ORF Transcript_36923/g.106483 Transcript_36923/m.106483 type:complete len:217 (-) Transcript_36923:1548-2198(-)